MNDQLEGIEEIAGTYVFDLRTSIKALNINRFFWKLARTEERRRYADDPEQAFEAANLSATECDLIRRKDWIGMIRYGVNFFVLEKFVRVSRMSNLEVYASMRGESFDDFMKTRGVQHL